MKKIILFLCFAMTSGLIIYQISNRMPVLHDVASQYEEEDSKYEEIHKNSDWYRAMSEPNADYFKVKSAYEKFFGDHKWEKSKTRQLGEGWLKTKLAYLDKDGRVQDEPPFEASRHTATHSVMTGTTMSVGSWDMLGPVNSFGAPYGSIYNHGGYVYLTRFDPTNTSKVFASFITGGLWMTSNDGADWTLTDANMPDDFYHDIDVCINSPSIVYAVTKTRVIKSKDGGLTYSNTGLTSATHPGIGYDIAVSPTDPNVVVARWNDKIYRTIDGGDTWAIITSGLPNHVVFDSGVISEMVDWSTTDNKVVYFLSTSHDDKVTVYRSGDAGATFSAIQTITLAAPANGLVVGWTKLLLPTNNTSHIYVAVGSGSNQNGHHAVHLYKLDKTTGTIATSRINMINGTAPNELHHGDLVMDRNDENKMIYGTYSQGKIHFSSDNGVTFTTPASDNTHSDIRSLDMIGGKIATGSDGELTISTNGGVTMSSISNPISNHELWGFGAAFKSDLIAVGTNHGPVMIKESHNGFDWYNGYGADQQNTDVNPLDDRYIHTRGYAQRRLVRTGPHTLISEDNLLDIGGLEYFNNVAFHPNLYNTMITHHAGGFPSGNPNLATWKNSLIRTDDQGNTISIVKTFAGQVYREKICMTNPNVMYVVVGLSNNKLWKTTNGGTTWIEVTPSLAESSSLTNISDIAVSDVDPNEVWIVYSGVQTAAKVIKSTNGGSSWPINLTTPTLSSQPTTRIVHQRGSNGGIYTANKDGVYYRNNTMSDWTVLGNGLPKMDIRWLFINYNLGKLRIGTSRGAWEHDLFETSPPKAQISADKQSIPCPQIATVQFRDYSTVRNASATWSWSFPGGTPSTSSLENPIVSYAGAADGNYNVTLSVTDAHGSDVQTLTNFIQVSGGSSGCSIDTMPGTALSIGSSTDDAQTTNALGISTDKITMSCWIKPNGAQSGNPGLITTLSGNATGLVIRGGAVGYVWGNNSYSWGYHSGLTVPADQWSHVAMVIQPGQAIMYLNGVPAFNNSHGSHAIDFSSKFYFGSDRGNSSDHFIGDMDEICIYNRALTTDEIRELMHLTRNNPNAGSLPTTDASLVAYYQLNEVGTSPIYDKTGGNHANLSGSALRTTSTAPVGGGTFQRMNVNSGGLKNFLRPEVEITFPASGTYPNGDIVVTRINLAPDHPAGVNPVSPPAYWVVNNFGINPTFSELESITFKGLSGVISGSFATYGLHKRASNAMGDTWGTPIDGADAATSNSLTFSTANGINSFSQFMLNRGVILPVELIDFQVQSLNGKEVEVSWETATEVANDYFDVEWSTDGRVFTTIGQVASQAENSTQTLRYEFIHTSPNRGVNHYRLKQVDLDGTFTRTEIKRITLNALTTEFVVYPNPAVVGKPLFINTNTEEAYSFTVYDSKGRRVFNGKFQGDTEVDIPALKSGFYAYQIELGDRVVNGKLIVD
ncbi:LamG-like jellyroll fold domain-containing protein [Neolewinella persica]|uniref:LamG-like jellyroll fold domain-containing protein n=1 Tax=Neolewinella persica TaxID=70998 RepID=UPI000362899B|nr:LamG-like jellyroll fold domain-containing protein [Neolewinella persica]